MRFAPAPGRNPEITTATVNHACQMADREESPHILGFSTQKDRGDRMRGVPDCFRFRWCDQLVKLLHYLATPDPGPFWARLIGELAEEEDWSSRVKPADMGSPLLLPEGSFTVAIGHRDLWRHARSYGDPANIVGAQKAIRAFSRDYLKKDGHYKWIDDRDLVFGRDGPRHADAPFPRAWKFSYRLPDGFHYDVKHREERKFSITDARGKTHALPVKGYINMDPHGYVRD